MLFLLFIWVLTQSKPEADPGFQVRRAHLKKMRRAEGGAKIVRIFRVKNHDFTLKNNIIFSNFRSAPEVYRKPSVFTPTRTKV